jgi:23S rRNA pseudouridine2604 synthase
MASPKLKSQKPTHNRRMKTQLVTVLSFHLLVTLTCAFHARPTNRANLFVYAENLNAETDGKRVRLNKVFKATHSRRGADDLIASGRVTINDLPVESKGGTFVIPFKDVVKLDGKAVTGWEDLNVVEGATENFEYVKYYKPRGVTCTTDQSIEGNIIDEIAYDGYRPKHRIFPVGRLDKDTSGLILLTSDGRLPNASLRQSQKQPKTYHVRVDKEILDSDIQTLRDGIVITTVAQRDNTYKPLTAKTLPCIVNRLTERNDGIEMTIMEGRNRQIRKMLAGLNYNVLALRRVKFAGITLEGLDGPGAWQSLNTQEMEIIERILQGSETSGGE